MPLLLSSSAVLTWIITYFFGLIFLILFFRWVMKADVVIRHQKANIWLLRKLCEKEGVESSEIDKVMKTLKINQ